MLIFCSIRDFYHVLGLVSMLACAPYWQQNNKREWGERAATGKDISPIHPDAALKKLPTLLQNLGNKYECVQSVLPDGAVPRSGASLIYRTKLTHYNVEVADFVLRNPALVYGYYHPYKLEAWLRPNYFQGVWGKGSDEEKNLLNGLGYINLSTYSCGVLSAAAAVLALRKTKCDEACLSGLVGNYGANSIQDIVKDTEMLSKLTAFASSMTAEDKAGKALESLISHKKLGQTPGDLMRYTQDKVPEVEGVVLSANHFDVMVKKMVTALSQGQVIVPLLFLDNTMHYVAIFYAMKVENEDKIEYFVVRGTDGRWELWTRAALQRKMCGKTFAPRRLSATRYWEPFKQMSAGLSVEDYKGTLGRYAEGTFTAVAFKLK